MGEVDDLLADLARWTAGERRAGAAASRLRERWLRQQAAEEATFAGLTLDLAEQAVPVSIRTTAGRTHYGTIDTVGADFLVVRDGRGPAIFLRLGAVAVLRAASDAALPDAASAREPALEARLIHVLVGLAGERPRVRLVLGSGEAVTGELRAAGEDVLTVLLDGSPPARAYVPAGALDELTLLG